MRRTKQFSGLGVLPALAFATSCESFLDPSPSDVLTPENFYRTSADAVAATNAVYESTKWSYWLGFWYISDIATDDIMAGPRVGSGGHREGDYNFKFPQRPPGGMRSGEDTSQNPSNLKHVFRLLLLKKKIKIK